MSRLFAWFKLSHVIPFVVVISSSVLATSVEAQPIQYVDLGTLSVGDATSYTSHHTPNTVVWYKFTIDQPVLASNSNYLDIDTFGTRNFSSGNDTVIALFRNDGTFVVLDDDDGPGSLSQLTFGPGAGNRGTQDLGGAFYDGRDGVLVAGTYWLAVSGYWLNTGPIGWTASSTSTASGPIVVNVRFTAPVPPPTPPSHIDLGELVDATTTSRIDVHSPRQIVWYKFTLPTGAYGSAWLDIDTEGTTQFLVGNDTVIGLYDSNGRFIARDDDSGSDDLSQLSFGLGAGNRGNQGFSGLDYDGRNGDLQAGTYFLAVTGYGASFLERFEVVTNSNRQGAVHTNLRFNDLVSQEVIVSGSINFQDTDGNASNETLSVLVWDPTTSSSITSIDGVVPDAAGNFSVLLDVPDGTFDIYIKGNRHLQRLVANQVFANGLSGVTASLIAGDIDDNNEVGPSDFALLASRFGIEVGDPNYLPAADLDDDGEIGPSDFAILAARFGAEGDAP